MELLEALGAKADVSSLEKLHKELKYPSRILPQQLRTMYDRNGLASALVNARVEASWGEAAQILVDDEVDAGLTAIASEVHLFDAMFRADLRSEVTTWSLFIPGDDGEPAVWGADEVEITASGADGMPSSYRVGSVPIGASEAVHVVDTRYSASDVVGHPRLIPAYNRLVDLERVLGGGSEATFQRAFPRLLFGFPKSYKISDEERAALKQEVAEFAEATRKALTLDESVTQKSIDVALPQLQPTARELMVHAVLTFNVPMTEVTGEALVAHSASINLTSWHARMNRRRTRVLLPRIVRPCLYRTLEMRGALGGLTPADMHRVTVDWTEHADTPTTDDLTAHVNAIERAVDMGLDPGYAITLLPVQWFGPVADRLLVEEPEPEPGDAPDPGEGGPPDDSRG